MKSLPRRVVTRLKRVISGSQQPKFRALALNKALYADADAIPPDELSRLLERMRAFTDARAYSPEYADAWTTHGERLYLTFQFLREVLHDLPENPVGLECGSATPVTDYLLEDFPDVRWSNLTGDLREPWAVENASVDLIFCTEVLEHLNDPLPPTGFQEDFLQAGLAAALRQAHRVLKPGGLFFATTPNVASVYHFERLCYGYAPWFHFPHIHEYSVHELADAFTAAGLELVQWKSVHCMTLHARNDHTAVFRFLLEHGYPTDNRGDDLFLVARRTEAEIVDTPAAEEPTPVAAPPDPPEPTLLTVPEAIEAIRPYVRTTPEVRKQFQDAGLHIEPASFYSPVPTIDEVEGSFEYLGEGLPYCDANLFDDSRLTGVFAELRAYADEFNPERTGDVQTAQRFFWENGMFTHTDALVYYCMIRLLKPRRIIEVGSGFSTLVALEALERNGSGTITSIEPYPPAFFADLEPRLERLIQKKVQEIPLSFFNDELGDGDILFIDSTHTVKVGSDCVYLYLTVLPYLRSKVVLHAHDVFIPAAFPPHWAFAHQLYWTEHYLLYALLLDNPKFEVMYGTQYHMARHPEAMREMMSGKYDCGGCSLWFRRV